VRNLSLVVCGAPLASRASEVADALEAAGWSVSIVPTEAASAWHEQDAAARVFRQPDQAKPPRPDAVVVCPLTFNTANKWIGGYADTRPLSLLCESLGAGVAVVAVPFVNESLWGHPAWDTNLAKLGKAGVTMIDPATGDFTPRPLQSGSGSAVTERFDPAWVVAALGS
jgi:phosphopantothenoylcysteine synthetase/decarboxylase